MAIDTDKLHEFLGKFVTDLGATTAAGNVVIGHNLGLYKALAAAPASAEELAAATQTSPRYVAEWLRGSPRSMGCRTCCATPGRAGACCAKPSSHGPPRGCLLLSAVRCSRVATPLQRPGAPWP